MDKITALTALNKGLKAVSLVLLFKSVVGFSIATLALFGVVVPLFGFAPAPAAEGGAAVFGAILGAVLALRS